MSVGGFALITACLASMLAMQVHCSCKCDCPSPLLYQTHKIYMTYPDQIRGRAYQGGNPAYLTQTPAYRGPDHAQQGLYHAQRGQDHAQQGLYHAQRGQDHAQQGLYHAQEVPYSAFSVQGGVEAADHGVGQEQEKPQESSFLSGLAQAQEASKCAAGSGRGYCGDEGKGVQQFSPIQSIEKPKGGSNLIEREYFGFSNGVSQGIPKESPIGEAKKESHNEEDEDHHQSHHHEHDKNVHYKFAYAVNDKNTRDVKYQKEERKGDVVTGEYALLEDDGNVRTVKYVADWKSGFRALVSNSKKRNSDHGFSR